MNGRMKIVGILFLIAMTIASGCCSFSSKPCCSSYDQIKPAQFKLSVNVVSELDKENQNLATKKDPEVRLSQCRSAISDFIEPEIESRIKEACKSSKLSEKERNDCLDVRCRDRMRAEWYEGLTGIIQEHLSECRQFSFDSKRGIYKKRSP